MNQQAAQDIPLEEMTVNGVRVGDLPATTQKIFGKIVAMKKEADELQEKLGQKQAALKELADMVVSDVSDYKAAQEQAAAAPVQ